ncbi:thymidylate kinase, partial [Frankia sp. QA3]
MLLGIDGAGKSTQARRLARTLSAAGQPASYF